MHITSASKRTAPPGRCMAATLTLDNLGRRPDVDIPILVRTPGSACNSRSPFFFMNFAHCRTHSNFLQKHKCQLVWPLRFCPSSPEYVHASEPVARLVAHQC